MNGAAAGFVPAGGGGGYAGSAAAASASGGAEADLDEMGGLAAGWMEMGRGMDDGFPVTALAFDPVDELLWVRSAACCLLTGCGVWCGVSERWMGYGVRVPHQIYIHTKPFRPNPLSINQSYDRRGARTGGSRRSRSQTW
jgi:hypothetical protein